MSSWFPTIHTSFHTFSTTPSHLIPARPCATFSHAALRGISYGWQPLFWYVSSFILPFQLSQRVYVWTMLLQCGSIAVYGGAYVTRNQDPRWTQKPIYTPIFTHHIRSWLLCGHTITYHTIPYRTIPYTMPYHITQNPRWTRKPIYTPICTHHKYVLIIVYPRALDFCPTAIISTKTYITILLSVFVPSESCTIFNSMI